MVPRTHIRRSIQVPLACVALVASLAAGCGSSDERSSGKGTKSDKSAAAPAPSGGAAKSAVTVKIADFKFVPDPIRVKAGGSVTWTNTDTAPHTAQTEGSATGAFDTKRLDKGASRKVTFAKPGKYQYFCVFHRFMTGTVDVVG
jgi:plastocyanin